MGVTRGEGTNAQEMAFTRKERPTLTATLMNPVLAFTKRTFSRKHPIKLYGETSRETFAESHLASVRGKGLFRPQVDNKASEMGESVT